MAQVLATWFVPSLVLLAVITTALIFEFGIRRLDAAELERDGSR